MERGRAVITIQRAYRKHRQHKLLVDETVALQALARGYILRRRLRRRVLDNMRRRK